MRQTERIEAIKRWLDSGRCLGPDHLADRFGVSLATIKRDIDHLRRQGAPIDFDRERHGWHLNASKRPHDAAYALAVSLREDEIHALLAMHHLLSGLDASGLLGRHIGPLRRKLSGLLEKGLHAPADVARRIRVLAHGERRLHLPHFQAVAHALLRRCRVHIVYHQRKSGRTEARDISPQRLLHYRDNWYAVAWCHLRDGLRVFSVDAIREARVLETAAIDLPDHELDEAQDRGYGIFFGTQVRVARLRFTPEGAKWAAAGRWHPNQIGHFDAHGHWLLDVPYADDRELAMDILRYVPEVEVLWPEELADEVLRRMREGLRRMEGGAG